MWLEASVCWCEALCSELCSNRKSNRLRVSSFPQRDSFTVSGSNPAVWNSRVAPPPCRCVTSNQSNQCNHCCWINYKNLYFINVKKTCCYVKIQAIKYKWILDICGFFLMFKTIKEAHGSNTSLWYNRDSHCNRISLQTLLEQLLFHTR